jgi:VWFA-related protein
MRSLAVAALALAVQAAPQPPRTVIRSGAIYVTTDVRVRDERGQFVADLRQQDFDVYEDGVPQAIAGFTLTHGGRVIADTLPAAASVGEGLLLPPPRPPSDASGRILVIFVDDLHIAPRETSRVRALLQDIRHELLHPGDLAGIVSTGYSSIAVDLTYDHKRIDEAIRKVMGSGQMPSDIVGVPEGSQGPVEVRHRAHTAFSTAYDILKQLDQVHNRRKAFIYISEGYDFDPYAQSRAKASADRIPTSEIQPPESNPFTSGGNEFAAADLAAELAELTRAANRANAAFYTIDPRGLVGGPDIDQAVDARDWLDHVRETQSSLRVIAELTGGFAAVNTNAVASALKRIDGETSDYYLIGYYSSNADPLKKRRAIQITVKPTPKRRTDRYQLSYRTSYALTPR